MNEEAKKLIIPDLLKIEDYKFQSKNGDTYNERYDSYNKLDLKF